MSDAAMGWGYLGVAISIFCVGQVIVTLTKESTNDQEGERMGVILLAGIWPAGWRTASCRRRRD